MVRARREIEPGKVIETEERGCTLASKVKVVERPFKEVTSELRLECENGARHEKIDLEGKYPSPTNLGLILYSPGALNLVAH